MYKISNIISTPIISLYEGEDLGIIYNILFDTKTKKCKYLCVLNEIENVEKSLEINDIYQIGKDCIFVKNNTNLELKCNNDHNYFTCISAINLNVFDINGVLLGKCIDIELDNKFSIENIILNNNTSIPASRIINLGKSVIIISEKTIRINKFKPKQELHAFNQNDKVYILNVQEQTPSNTKLQTSNNKIIIENNMLKNRIATQDIIAYNGELIIRKGSQITQKTLTIASMYGKLIELTRYSM